MTAKPEPKPKTKPRHLTPEQQAENFRALARELECDEVEEAFKAKVGKVATAPRLPKGAPKNTE